MQDKRSLPVPNHLGAELERRLRKGGQWVVDRVPASRGPVYWLWGVYVRRYAQLNCLAHSIRYARRAPIEPFEVLEVDPDDVEFLVEADGYPQQTSTGVAFPRAKYKYAGTVHGGDWDTRRVRFEETDVFRAFEAHFEEGVPWESTAFFHRVVDYLDDGVVLWGCADREDFVSRCATLDRLYERIRDRGYQSQRALSTSGCDDPFSNTERTLVVRLVYDELTVCVGRDGSLRFFDGRNRLAIAELLDLDAVPAWVMLRHRDWQEYRERLAARPAHRRGVPDRLEGHPDLRRIVGAEADGSGLRH